MVLLTRMLVAVVVGVSVAVSRDAITPLGQSSGKAFNGVCSKMKLLSEVPSLVKTKVLQKLCKAGWRHVLLTRAKQDEEQFAFIYLHRDDFSEMVQWYTGDAQDWTTDTNWWVDEEVAIPAGQGYKAAGATSYYHWYRHGLPMWPLQYQSLPKPTHKKIRILFWRPRISDWPNYALATPLYLVPYEKRNYRNPELSIGKSFAAMKKHKIENFVQTSAFYEFVRNYISNMGNRIVQHPKFPRNWLAPLLDFSLPNMLLSFKTRQRSRAPKKAKVSRCPDQLYVFLLREPCHSDLLNLTKDLATSLTAGDCSNTTSVVVGCSKSLPQDAC